jgi:hypothetical protein
MTTKIFVQHEAEDTYCAKLGWHEGIRLATKEELLDIDRCPGSIWEALEPGEDIELAEGIFKLDEELDLI